MKSLEISKIVYNGELTLNCQVSQELAISGMSSPLVRRHDSDIHLVLFTYLLVNTWFDG